MGSIWIAVGLAISGYIEFSIPHVCDLGYVRTKSALMNQSATRPPDRRDDVQWPEIIVECESIRF